MTMTSSSSAVEVVSREGWANVMVVGSAVEGRSERYVVTASCGNLSGWKIAFSSLVKEDHLSPDSTFRAANPCETRGGGTES